MRRVTFWWCIPCKAISGVFRELAELPGYRVSVVCGQGLTNSRIMLGWEFPDFGRAEVIVLPDTNWKLFVHRTCAEHMDAIHIFGGEYAHRKTAYALRYVQLCGLPTGIIAEAPINFDSGLRRVLKEIYLTIIVPWRVRGRARRSLFLLSASGKSRIDKFCRLGYARRKIFPFGYFAEAPQAGTAPGNYDPNRNLQLLCTGYLRPYKGHAILLSALSIVRRHVKNFRCIITGYGPLREPLEKLAGTLGLAEHTRFVGVVPNTEMARIMRETDIFVAPGRLEPWGIRINEALQFGIPVVVSDGIGASELVRVSGAGAVFSKGDAESLAAKLIELLGDVGKLNVARQKAIAYAPRIHPQQAAAYLHQVLEFVSGKSGHPGLPAWLKGDVSEASM